MNAPCEADPVSSDRILRLRIRRDPMPAARVDEGPRPDASLEGLARLRPVFAAKAA